MKYDNKTVEDWLGAENRLGIDIWNKKYRWKEESFAQWLDRVSGGDEELADLIWEKKFLFGGRILAMRGVSDGTKASYSNCYVLEPPKDNLESIYDTCKKLARTYSYGGGCGIDISGLAPAGAVVHNQAKTSSGAVSFMDTFSQVTQQIGQAGRRGALMISMDCTHPDLEAFIGIKNDLSKVNYANISVRVTNAFMQAVVDDQPWTLRFERPETGEVIERTVSAKELFRKICENNWNYAEPGVLFWDKITKYNLLEKCEFFEYAGTNPCGEEPLPANGACLLGAINLAEFVAIDYEGNPFFQTGAFVRAVETAVRALDTVQIEGLEKHPLPEQRECARELRQIGLGVMGVADMLIKLGITYGSIDALGLCDEIGAVLARTALRTSNLIAMENHHPYALWDTLVLDSAFAKRHLENASNLRDSIKRHGLAHSQLLTIAPTGTISTMLGVSGGMEPIFANSYTRTTKTLHGHDQLYKVYTPIVAEYMKAHGLESEDELPECFVTSADIPIENRLAMQAVWQKHIDASISSTINLPNSATVEDVERVYIGAWQAGLKGVTVYRAGCAREGILTAGDHTPEEPAAVNKPMKKNIGLERHLTTGCGSLHICAFFDENGDLKNTYLSKGSTGGCNNFMIGLSRMISLSARNGIPLQAIIDQLNSCGTCPSYAVRRATLHDTSPGSCCPVAVGSALLDMWREVNAVDKDELHEQAESQEISSAEDRSSGDSCPECGGRLIHEMGCVTCASCGYSKCG